MNLMDNCITHNLESMIERDLRISEIVGTSRKSSTFLGSSLDESEYTNMSQTFDEEDQTVKKKKYFFLKKIFNFFLRKKKKILLSSWKR